MRRGVVIVLACLAAVASAADERPFSTSEPRAECAVFDPLRRPHFGDLHVHTAYSWDAYADGTRGTPRDAYRFAKGGRIGIPPYDAAGRAVRSVQLTRPLDFAAVTDHAEMLGEVSVCQDPSAGGYATFPCWLLRNVPAIGFRLFGWKTLYAKGRFDLCGENAAGCNSAARGVWADSLRAADEAYDRSAACRFTSFVGYEWTGIAGRGLNLHRNVIFRNARVPDAPISWVDSKSAMDLWRQLEARCVRGLPGCEALAIPHNANLSGGLMFESAAIETIDEASRAITAPEARIRARWEPLVEIYQHKGDSECSLGAGEADEECGWEKLPHDNFASQTSPLASRQRASQRSFVRSALLEGLRLERALGANPFRFGVIGSTDTHIAAPGLTEEATHAGHAAARPAASGEPGFVDALEFSPGGLAVLWAEENTRDALFAAMRRREAYATSGTRPVVRLFGGWDYGAQLCSDAALVEKGYSGGVPMGGELSAPPASEAAPTLLALALMDPGSATRPGTPLQRIQIVKGWLDARGASHERVLDVAGGPNGASVDLTTCVPRGRGAKTLCSAWRDPDFDSKEPAFYYARVLENPTCRWSQYACVAAHVDCTKRDDVPGGLAGCCAPEHRPAQQERAWTSPIWYSPRTPTKTPGSN